MQEHLHAHIDVPACDSLCVCVRLCVGPCVSIGLTEQTDRGLARVGLTNQIRTKQVYIGRKAYVCVCVCVRCGSPIWYVLFATAVAVLFPCVNCMTPLVFVAVMLTPDKLRRVCTHTHTHTHTHTRATLGWTA